MKVLVIGNHGQLARALVESASSRDTSVVAMGRPKLDLLKPTTIAHAIEEIAPDVVVNTAAYTAVDKAEVEPGIAFATNAEGASFVAEACAQRDTPLIHISTDYVFNGVLSATLPRRRSASPAWCLWPIQARRGTPRRRCLPTTCHPSDGVGLQPLRK